MGRAWERATSRYCPLHPAGGCGWSSHGTYVRKRPAPTPIARAYCPTGHTTFSFLPDFFASRLPGTLDELEHVAATVEAAPSVEKAADALRSGEDADAVTIAAAVRWTARRVALVAAVLLIVVGVFADELEGVRTVADLRRRLGTSHALMALRAKASGLLGTWPPPIGFGPRARCRRRARGARQHETGPDPPRSTR